MYRNAIIIIFAEIDGYRRKKLKSIAKIGRQKKKKEKKETYQLARRPIGKAMFRETRISRRKKKKKQNCTF